MINRSNGAHYTDAISITEPSEQREDYRNPSWDTEAINRRTKSEKLARLNSVAILFEYELDFEKGEYYTNSGNRNSRTAST